MPNYCATCFKEEGVETKKLIGGVCADCHKKMKGAHSVDDSTGMPKFASYADLEKFIKNTAKDEKEKPKPEKKPKGRKPIETGTNSGSVANEEVYQTNHFYVRGGDSIEALRKDVKEERKLRNSNVLIFIHNHNFGLSCNDQCKEVT